MVATVTRLKAAATMVHYFEADGYYAKNDPEHRKASGWHGEAAALLGLHGPVKPKRFEAVLAGYVPGTDLRLGRLRDGEHQHRPGVVVTFSAPKSVSLEALVYAPRRTGARVVKAHDEAVRATLGFIETELLQTRSYDPATGRRRIVLSGPSVTLPISLSGEYSGRGLSRRHQNRARCPLWNASNRQSGCYIETIIRRPNQQISAD